MVNTFDLHRARTKCGTLVLCFWLVSLVFSVSGSSDSVQICGSRDQPIGERNRMLGTASTHRSQPI